MNKISTKLQHNLPCICEFAINRKTINPCAANLLTNGVDVCSSIHFHHVQSLLFGVRSSVSEQHSCIFIVPSLAPPWSSALGSRLVCLMVAPALNGHAFLHLMLRLSL